MEMFYNVYYIKTNVHYRKTRGGEDGKKRVSWIIRIRDGW